MRVLRKFAAATAALFLFSPVALSQVLAPAQMTYEQALNVWETTKDREQYQSYAQAFAQWNNHFQLDTRNGCYAKGKEPLTILLVISDKAEIGPVMSSVGGEKAECFRLTYLGLKVGAPPFSPLVIRLNIE